MNLPSSIVVSGFVIASVWFALLFQPEAVWAQVEATQYTLDPQEVNQEATSTKPSTLPETTSIAAAQVTPNAGAQETTLTLQAEVSLPKLSLQGVSLETSLQPEAIANLWLEFADRYDLHRRLNKSRINSYAIYRNFNSDFSRALVSIGYNSTDLDGSGEIAIQLAENQYTELLSPAQHSAEKMATAWQDIDYTRELEAIVEQHALNSSGQVVASSLYVLYR